MVFFIQCLFFLQLALLGKIRNPYKDVRVDKVTQTYITDQLQETDSALELCASKENLAKWIANERINLFLSKKLIAKSLRGI